MPRDTGIETGMIITLQERGIGPKIFAVLLKMIEFLFLWFGKVSGEDSTTPNPLMGGELVPRHF